MIVTQDERITVTSTLSPGETRVMGIDQTALASIIDSMVNLYSDKYLAVLREYSTNARDAMVAAGNTDPIRITLPSEFDQQLIISDTGVGMTRDELLDRFSQYGASDKRDTNTQVGSFGYGCKSAFAISDQFVVTAIKDGRKTVALFSRNENRVGVASILSETDTNDRAGVTVAVPIPDAGKMAQTASTFFAWWAPGTVLVDDEEPHSLIGACTEFGRVLYSPQKLANDAVTVLMGGVVYPLGNLVYESDWRDLDYMNGLGNLVYESDWRDLYYMNGTMMIKAEIGEVDIVPSREGLRDSPRTKAFLQRTVRDFRSSVTSITDNRIGAADSLYGAALMLSQAQSLISRIRGGQSFTWKGKSVSTTASVLLPGYTYFIDKKTRLFGGFTESIVSVNSAQTSPNILVITGVPDNNPRLIRRGMHHLCDEKGYQKVFVAPDDSFRFDWFTKDIPIVEVMTYEDYREWGKNIPANENPKAYVKTVYTTYADECWIESDSWSLAQLRKAETLFYVTDKDSFSPRHIMTTVGPLPGAVCVALSGRQNEEVFLRRLPHAKHVRHAVDSMVIESLKGWTSEDRQALIHYFWAQRNNYAAEKMAQSLAPHLHEITNATARTLLCRLTDQRPLRHSNPVMRYTSLSNTPNIVLSRVWRNYDAALWTEVGALPLLTDVFPLLHNVNDYDSLTKQHIIAYFNAVTHIPAALAA